MAVSAGPVFRLEGVWGFSERCERPLQLSEMAIDHPFVRAPLAASQATSHRHIATPQAPQLDAAELIKQARQQQTGCLQASGV